MRAGTPGGPWAAARKNARPASLPRYSRDMFRTGGVRTSTLRRASAVVFALISVLPLLLFVYTLYTLNVLHHHVAQLGLASALVLSLLGFYIYAVMMSRLSDLLRSIEAGQFPSAPPATSPAPEASGPPEPGPSGPAAGRSPAGGRRKFPLRPSLRRRPFAPKGSSGAGKRGGLVVPGIGRITELKPADASALADLDSMWRAEAQPLLGKRVLVAVRNDPDPMRGVLVEVARVGVILDQGGSRVSVSYGRMSMIEAETVGESP